MSLSYNYPFFDNLPGKISGIALTMPDAEVRFYPGFFAPVESDRFFQDLMNNVDWRQSSINTPRGRVPFPRLVAWYGDEDALYSYSGVTYKPAPWTPALLSIKTRIEAVAQVEFNSVLLNL